MASIINASNTSGIIVIPDYSGVLQLQANGVPSISIDVYGRPVMPVTGIAPIRTSGAFEYANNTLMFTSGTVQSGSIQHGYQTFVLGTPLVGLNATGNQNVVGVGVSLTSNTAYAFESSFTLNKTAGTSSHTISFGFGGTAVLNYIIYDMRTTSVGAALNVRGASTDQQSLTSNTINQTVVTGALTSAALTSTTLVKGVLFANSGGIFTPQYSLSTAPGGAYTTLPGSYFTIYPIATYSVPTGQSILASNIVLGTWA